MQKQTRIIIPNFIDQCFKLANIQSSGNNKLNHGSDYIHHFAKVLATQMSTKRFLIQNTTKTWDKSIFMYTKKRYKSFIFFRSHMNLRRCTLKQVYPSADFFSSELIKDRNKSFLLLFLSLAKQRDFPHAVSYWLPLNISRR